MEYLINIVKNQLLKYKQLQKNVIEQQKMLEIMIAPEFFNQTHKIEVLMNDIRILERNKQKYLDENGYSLQQILQQNNELAEFVADIAILASDIKNINDCNKVLLKNKMDFITFNVNVLTQTTNNAAYQHGGDLSAGDFKKIKMFDQSI